jgi:hypothetical protein
MKRDPRCKFSIKEEQEMIRLYNSGMCLRQVGDKFDVPSNRISKILEANCVKRRFHGEGTRLLHEHLNVSIPECFPDQLKNAFPKLLAVFLLTDGYIKKGGGIMLICTDEILQRYFLALLKQNYGLAPTTNSYMKRGKETIVHNTTAVSELLRLSPSYNTYPRNCSVEDYFRRPQPTLSFLENEDISVLKEAVRIAMSTDGTMLVDFSYNSVYPRLEFGCAHPNLLCEWREIFKKVGLESYVLKSKVTWSGYKGIGIKKIRIIERFIEIGGFIDGVKITGKSIYYKGITKNNLLNLAFGMNKKSFQFPEDMNTPEKNKIIRDMITSPVKRTEWMKIGVEYPKIKKKIEKLQMRQNVLDFVRDEVSNGRFPAHKILRENLKTNVQNYFKGGIGEIYGLAGVKTKKEFLQDNILDFVKNSAKNKHYPTGEEIDETFHTNFRQFFKSIVDLYEKAGVRYPRVINNKY